MELMKGINVFAFLVCLETALFQNTQLFTGFEPACSNAQEVPMQNPGYSDTWLRCEKCLNSAFKSKSHNGCEGIYLPQKLNTLYPGVLCYLKSSIHRFPHFGGFFISLGLQNFLPIITREIVFCVST